MAKATWENSFVRSIFGRHLGLLGDPQAASPRPALVDENNNVLPFGNHIILAAAGLAAAGAVTIAGTQVGDKVVSVTNLSTPGDSSSSFETTVSAAGKVQQTSASNLSASTFLFVVYPQAAV